MKNKIFYIIFFAIILSIYRIIPHPANFTPIIAVSILSPLIFKDKILSILLVVGTMFISDFFIGFHSYQFIIYLTLISITLIAPMKKNYSTLGILAIGSSVWFFLVTSVCSFLVISTCSVLVTFSVSFLLVLI